MYEIIENLDPTSTLNSCHVHCSPGHGVAGGILVEQCVQWLKLKTMPNLAFTWILSSRRRIKYTLASRIWVVFRANGTTVVDHTEKYFDTSNFDLMRNNL